MSEENVNTLAAEMNASILQDGTLTVKEGDLNIRTITGSQQTDLEKLQAALENLKQAGETLFADQIAELESKIEEEKAKVEAETEKAVEVVTQTEQSFVQKYGANIVKGVELVLLGLIAGRILGVL